MDKLPTILAWAWLLPLASFAVIWIGYSVPQLLGVRVPYEKQKIGAYISISAIVLGAVLSLYAFFFIWLPAHPLTEPGEHAAAEHTDGAAAEGGQAHTVAQSNPPPAYQAGNWYDLAVMGKLRLSIGYYIDTLTVAMFCVVTIIASCVHIYAFGYMHDELAEYVDHEVTLADGHHLHRRGRFHRFFQYLSLFSFSMLGICIAGNLAMVFVFWELVGICSYFLIGFYIERKSASTAANKAFIVNRVGDFGMLIGLMAIWSSLGTFYFGDKQDAQGQVVKTEAGEIAEPGIFSLLHEQTNGYKLVPAEGMVASAVRDQVATAVKALGPNANAAAIEGAVTAAATQNRTAEGSRAGQWLLFIAGVGIFCGCVGKSAQFPLHVWLPDAMEGPTPVSAPVHSATMVAAGVFLVGRCYPIFSPEALLVIAIIGCVTLFMAASIAITAVDIKRVLAYSTISQLGYMMLALGLGGWVAGLFHLITHAFFKSLLFLCSGSVIHAVHTNDMRQMGGLRHKMPITAYAMLAGCLAISGVGIPFLFGFSGFHSKDLIIEQSFSFAYSNTQIPYAWLFVVVPLVGALMTSFYMFRLWYMTFAGKPRDHHRYDHAHESPPVMSRVLVFLAVFAVGIGWWFPAAAPGVLSGLGVESLLEHGKPVGMLGDRPGQLMTQLVVPDELAAHNWDVKRPAGISAILVALAGIAGATVVYLWEMISAASLRRWLSWLYHLTWNKWWFDELYDFVFVQPVLQIGRFIAWVLDRGLIDGIIHTVAYVGRGLALVVAGVGDRWIIDNAVDTFAEKTWELGLSLRSVQTGRVRQYVMFIVVGTIVLFLVASLWWKYAVAGG